MSDNVVPDKNVESQEPSTSDSSTSQPMEKKNSMNNKNIDYKVSLKNSHKKTMKHKSKIDGTENSPITNTNLTETYGSNQCERTNSNPDEVVPEENVGTPKRKNAKKKERLKNLQIPKTNNQQVPLLPDPQIVSLQQYFEQCLAPMYASTSSRYLENLCHHPQFRHINNVLLGPNNMPILGQAYPQNAASVPNTPINQIYLPNFSSATNSPAATTQPKFLQNVMQHPLLSKSFSMDSHNRLHTKSESTQRDRHNSPRHKKKNIKQEQTNAEFRFDPYMSKEEVIAGLENNTLIEGVLRINPKQFQHSYVSSTDRSEQDILIDGMKTRNRALEGDIVVVQLVEDINNEIESQQDSNKQKKGKVVYIKEKVHTRKCIGNLKLMSDKNRQRALFVPRDHRIPRLNIPFTCWPDNFYQDYKKYESTLFLAIIEDWFDTRFAMGKIICNIGQSGDIMTETKAILAQNDLDITPFGPEVREFYPRLDDAIPDEEIKIREDCRKLCIFSIDPPNCRDIDDAVSCRELENGNYEIGVHISDVAHYLAENTVLDEKVADKATTIYLVERAYHMLPDDLCMLCSLFPGVDKLAFSVFWEIDKNTKVLSTRFAKTVINSCAQLAYDHAQAVLEDRENAESVFPETYNGYTFNDIQKAIKILGKISSTFRNNRFENGALRIDQPKVSFTLNASNGLPDSFWLYESKESHQLIEEFMLLANMSVAQKIHEDHPKLAFLRCHPPPSAYMLKQLAKSLQPMGIELNTSSAGDLHKSLSQYLSSEDKGKAMVLNMLCAKPMTRAKYFCAYGCQDDDFLHYALNVPLYTHFTSPIRRYADIMVHRLLAASIKFRDTPTWEVDKVRMVAAQCNKQKYNAKKAGEMSTELYTLKYIELNSPVVTEAVVVDIREKYIDTIVASMGLNRRIFFNNDFPGEYKCIKHDAGTKLSKMELIWKIDDVEIPQTIEVFSILMVELVKGDDMVKVETKLMRPK